jgi:hypothetical protein
MPLSRSRYGHQHTEACASSLCQCFKDGYVLGQMHGKQSAAGRLRSLAEQIGHEGAEIVPDPALSEADG